MRRKPQPHGVTQEFRQNGTPARLSNSLAGAVQRLAAARISISRMLRSRHGKHATALLCAGLLSGCDDASARVYSVTLQEPATIKCEGASFDTSVYAEDTLKGLAGQARRAWKADKERRPPRPVGYELHVVEVAGSMRAWFEQPNNSDAAAGFGAVFEGDVEEDFLEARHQRIINTDDEDESAELQPCGPRVTLDGTLSATDVDGGISGRIRWSDIQHLSSETSRCAATITCHRNVMLWGAEQ